MRLESRVRVDPRGRLRVAVAQRLGGVALLAPVVCLRLGLSLELERRGRCARGSGCGRGRLDGVWLELFATGGAGVEPRAPRQHGHLLLQVAVGWHGALRRRRTQVVRAILVVVARGRLERKRRALRRLIVGTAIEEWPRARRGRGARILRAAIRALMGRGARSQRRRTVPESDRARVREDSNATL